MKNFKIDEVLIYNPKIKSQKKKPIESDIQQAKIIAFYPSNAQIQQKCNTVGMAEGVYDFCNSLIPDQIRQTTSQAIFMDSCCLVQKQFEENIWIFIKVNFQPDNKYNQKKNEQSEVEIQTGYLNSSFTQEILNEFINHFYLSFKIFFGKISAFLFLQKLFQLQKVIDHFVPRYQEIHSYPGNKNMLDISSYLIQNIRAIPLDVNMTLKFGYFKNVMQSYQPSVMDLIIFTNGILTYSTLEKQTTQFFARYLFGTNEPFRFQPDKIQKKFKILKEMPSFNNIERYGTIFNSIYFGFNEQDNKKDPNPRSSISLTRVDQSQDLLGMQQKFQIELDDVYLIRNGEQVKWKISYFIEKNMIFLTFYQEISTLSQIIFANRFFHDNSHKFYTKIIQTFSNFISQSDSYRFLFCNKSTSIGKCTFKDWSTIGNQIKYTLNRIKNSTQGQITTTFQNHWVYGVKRMNRILILLIPNQVPLHKIEDYTSKMTKEYFYKCFM